MSVRLKNHRKTQRGFALLLTLIVIGVIGAVAFGVGYLTLHSYSATVRFQDSQSALQAAEAGIEDGLLRFRYDRNVEVPYFPTVAPSGTSNGCDSSLPEPTDSTKFVLRVNLTTGQLQCLDPTAVGASVPDPTQIVYDLKIFYKSTLLGDFNGFTGDYAKDSTNPNNPQLKKDDAVQFSTGDPIKLKASLADNTNVITGSIFQHGFELIFYDASGNIVATRLLDQSNDPKYLAGLTVNPPIGTAPIAKVGLKSINQSAVISVSPFPLSSRKTIDFGISRIETVGYSNSVKRKLGSAINRTTGTLNGTNNFVLFNGTNSVLSP